MSYDLNIKIKESVDYQVIKSFINSLPNTDNLRLKILNQFYMEIDLEFIDENEEYKNNSEGKINIINFHIPYSFMDKMIDPDIYYNYVLKISEHLGEKAYDLQLDLYLDDPNFKIYKRWKKSINIDFVYNKFEIKEHKILFSNSISKYKPLEIDLKSYSINLSKNIIDVEPEFEDFNEFIFCISPDNKLIALSNWKEKCIKVFQNNNLDYKNNVILKDFWQNKTIITFEKCGQIRSLKFSDDGKYLFSNAYKNKIVKKWEVETGNFKNFSSYSNHVSYFHQISINLLCICSSSGIGFFNIESGNNILQIVILKENWIVFTPEGDYESKYEVNFAIELDYIDNAKSESFCFFPNVGFGYLEGYPNYKTNRIKICKGIYKVNLMNKLFC